MPTNLFNKLLMGIVMMSMFNLNLLAQYEEVYRSDFHHDGIFYNITSSNLKTVSVTNGSYDIFVCVINSDKDGIWESWEPDGEGCDKYVGDVNIPETVNYNGITYSVTSIESSAFSGCSGLTSVNIPNSLTSIGGSAFSGCSGLKTVIFHCQTIGSWFSNNSSIENIIIGDEVTTISSSAFSGCSGLTTVNIPNSVTSIGDNAFNNCSNLPIEDNCRYADTYLVEVIDKTIAQCIIKEGTRFIGTGALKGCSSLTIMDIPNSVISIGGSAFEGCSGLTSVIIPNSVTSIGCSAFFGCSGLTSVEIPNSVTTINSSAFENCSNLTSVTIGSGIKTIDSKAFANYNNLMDVYCLAEEVPTTTSDIFDNSYVKYATLHVPEFSINLYKRSEPWSQFGSFVGIPEENNENKCEKPVITLLANGKIKVESATEGATCVTNITASNAEPLTDGEISLSTPLTVYTVTSYATKDGYDDSEVTTATFRYEKAEGDINGDGILNISDVVHLVNMILGQ